MEWCSLSTRRCVSILSWLRMKCYRIFLHEHLTSRRKFHLSACTCRMSWRFKTFSICAVNMIASYDHFYVNSVNSAGYQKASRNGFVGLGLPDSFSICVQFCQNKPKLFMSTSGRTQLKGQAGFICSISIEPVYVCVCDTLARWLAHLTACVFNVLEAYTGSSDNRGSYCYSELTSLLQVFTVLDPGGIARWS